MYLYLSSGSFIKKFSEYDDFRYVKKHVNFEWVTVGNHNYFILHFKEEIL